MSHALQEVLRYHARTKHNFHAYARGPGYLNWDTQPNPFRRYAGAPLLPLDHLPPGDVPLYEPAFLPGLLPVAVLDRRSVSQLLYDSLSLSAWKAAGDNRWALRVNPSSGNLHPTEGYVLCSPVEGLTDTPVVAHYAPREHALEVRARLPVAAWRSLTEGFADGTLFVALTSIHWREAWKYGERAFRYCQHDVGHALGAVAIAAAGLGWGTRLVDDVSSDDLERLLGITDPQGVEREHADCLLAICPQDASFAIPAVNGRATPAIEAVQWLGTPNHLSSEHVDWQLDSLAEAVRKPSTDRPNESPFVDLPPLEVGASPLSLRRIIRQRRSAVAMDAHTGITSAAFYQILRKTLPGPNQVPFTTLAWRPMVDLVLFVHRVQGVTPGLYVLVRDSRRTEALRGAFRDDFEWERAEGCPAGIELYRLLVGDARRVAAQVSCGQDIAADGCFSVAMLAEYEGPLQERGAWFYPRLFWECGLLGQVLYLEAEASGIRATGIGCYFDDPVHELLGLQGRTYQDLYHFTLGGAIDDTRLSTLPAYDTFSPSNVQVLPPGGSR